MSCRDSTGHAGGKGLEIKEGNTEREREREREREERGESEL